MGNITYRFVYYKEALYQLVLRKKLSQLSECILVSLVKKPGICLSSVCAAIPVILIKLRQDQTLIVWIVVGQPRQF